MNTKTVTKERFIKANVEQVFAALSEKQELERWFVPKAEIELKPGGKFQIEWTPGMGEHGKVISVNAPTLLSYTWEALSPTPTTVTFELKAQKDGTLLQLAHSGIGEGEDWKVYATIGGAWDAHLNDLQSWIETGTCPPPGPRG